MRYSHILRETKETKIELSINLDGTGESNIDTGCGFLDHMLTLFASHGKVGQNSALRWQGNNHPLRPLVYVLWVLAFCELFQPYAAPTFLSMSFWVFPPVFRLHVFGVILPASLE